MGHGYGKPTENTRNGASPPAATPLCANPAAQPSVSSTNDVRKGNSLPKDQAQLAPPTLNAPSQNSPKKGNPSTGDQLGFSGARLAEQVVEPSTNSPKKGNPPLKAQIVYSSADSTAAPSIQPPERSDPSSTRKSGKTSTRTQSDLSNLGSPPSAPSSSHSSQGDNPPPNHKRS